MSDNNQANEHDNTPEGAGDEEVNVEEEFANSEQDGDTANYTWWNGQWPAARGKVAKDLAKNAGTELEQKASTKEIYSFLKHENSQLSLLDARTDNIAYLVNIPGTKLLRVGYGLAPKVTNLLNPNAATTLRLMMGDVDDLLTPNMISFPSNVRDCHKYRVPTDTLIDSMRDKWPDTWPVFKFHEVKDDNGNDAMLMKIAPVPFFVVLDGLDEDLEAGLLLERIQSMDEFEDEEYLQHAANFLKACLVQYQANQKKPSLETVAFTTRATKDDKTWAERRFTQFFPDLIQSRFSGNGPEKSGDLAAVLKLLLEHSKARELAQPAPISLREEAEDQLEGTWEKKLNLSTTALKNMLKFCGLEEGDEHRLPKYLFKLAEKHNTKGDKDSIIHQVLSKAYYQDAEVPITSFLLAVVRERNWTGGEVICTMANCMKGLSIFAMKDISDEALSRLNEEEDAREKATHTSPKDHLLSAKWKPEVPGDTAELIKYFQRYVNVLSALTMGQNPHCHHAQQIVGKLKRWSPSACKAMKMEMIASIMWVTLKEARRSFMGVDHDTLPEFDELMDCLDKKKEFVVLDLPAALIRKPIVEQDFRLKRPREPLEHKKPGGGLKKPRTPNPSTNVGKNDIIEEKCASLLKVMGEHKISLSKVCKACNTDVANLVPTGVCGQAAFFGQCYVRNCGFQHRKLKDDEVWKLLDCILPALDNPNIIIPKGQ